MRISSNLSSLLALCALSMAGIAGSWATSPGADHPAAPIVAGDLGAKLDDYMRQAADYGFSGAVLVAQDDRILLAKGYGYANRAKQLPFTAETPSCIGSNTKQFTAAAILKLEMQGKLRTDDPISRHLTDVPPDKSGVTIYHLLTHTAGFPEYSGSDYDKALRDETVRRILAMPLESQPGKNYSYSNAGYSVLAAIVEKTAGQPYEVYLRDQFFQPAGMQHTGYVLPRWNKDAVPHGYNGQRDFGGILDRPWSPDGPYWNLFGNGGILSTVGDMYRWRQALAGETILSAEAKKKLFTPFLGNYACGWSVMQTSHGTLIGHNGGNDIGFNATIAFYQTGPTIIVHCNSGMATSAGAGGYASLVADQLNHLIFGRSLQAMPRAASITVQAASLKEYEGVYESRAGTPLRVVLRAGQAILEPMGQEFVAFLALDASKKEEFNNLSQRADVIVSGLIRNDFAAMEQSTKTPAAFQKFRDYLSKQLRQWQANDGPVQKAIILGTVPSWWSVQDQEKPVTIVQLVLKNGKRIFRLHWQNGKIDAIGGAVMANPAATPLRPIAADQFLGWNLGIAKPVDVRFLREGRSSVTGISLRADGQEVIATKKGRSP